jgi:hypothetical protein
MSLLQLQQELARLLMEPEARQSFARSPKAHLTQRGVKGSNFDLLASLVPDEIAYFAQRRNVDRHQALRADAPRAVAQLEAEHGRLNLYFREHPYALEDPLAETAVFARWTRRHARQGTVSHAVADLAAFEAAVLALYRKTYRPTPATTKPRRATGARLLRLQTNLAIQLRRTKGVTAMGPNWMALLRVEDDVRWFALSDVETHLLRRATGQRTWQQWLQSSPYPIRATTQAARELIRDGLLAPRAPEHSPKLRHPRKARPVRRQ